MNVDRSWLDRPVGLLAKLDWEKTLSACIDPERARMMYDPSSGDSEKLCSMCGIYCAIRGTKRSKAGRGGKT